MIVTQTGGNRSNLTRLSDCSKFDTLATALVVGAVGVRQTVGVAPTFATGRH